MLLESIIAIFSCGREKASGEPTPSTVRAARKSVFEIAKSGDAIAERSLAKGVVLCENCKPFLSASLTHATAGLEDEAASQNYGVAIAAFELDMDEAYGDVGTYVHGTASQAPLTLVKYFKDVSKLSSACSEAVLRTKRWSSSTLEATAGCICEDLWSMNQVATIGIALLVKTLAARFLALIPESVNGDAAQGGSAGGANGADEGATESLQTEVAATAEASAAGALSSVDAANVSRSTSPKYVGVEEAMTFLGDASLN